MLYEQYASAVEELFNLNAKPTLTRRDELRQQSLLMLVKAGNTTFSPEEIRAGERDRLRREAGLPREATLATRRIPESVDREYRDAGLGRSVRLTHVPDDREVRANEAGEESIFYSGTSTTGRLVPWGLYPRFLESLKYADDIFQPWAHNHLETDTGAPTVVPSADDVTKQSVQVSEASQSSEVDIANFGQMPLGSWSFRTGRVVVSRELLQDSAYPIADVLERIFAKRHARGVGQAIVSGTGVNQPTGLLTAAAGSGCSVTIAAGSSPNDGLSEAGGTSLGTADFINALKGLDPAYWPGSIWAMNPATLLELWGQVDKQGRPLVNDYMSPGGMPTVTPFILGKRVAVCPSMPTVGNAHNSVILYHPDYFFVRSVPSSMYVRVFHEAANLVEQDCVAFESFYRVDSNLSVPNSSYAPCSLIQNHS